MKISVFGNIACGKSTLLKNLSKLGHEVFQEPVSDWHFLPKYYESPSRWCFALQMEILQSFSKYDAGPSTITERSAFEAFKIFATHSYLEGDLIKKEYDLIEYFSGQHRLPDKFVYIKLSPEQCYQRLKKRSRDCEENVTLSYLTKLHELYEKTIGEMKENGMDVEVINGDATERQMLDQFVRVNGNSIHFES